jgi:hypothetical protein
MGSPDQPRNAKGQWSAGGGSGAPSADTDTRYVPGHGSVPRSTVVAKHAGAASVGTSPPTVRLDNAKSPKDKGSRPSARRERTEMNLAVDQRSKPWRSDAAVTAITDQGKPTGTWLRVR